MKSALPAIAVLAVTLAACGKKEATTTPPSGSPQAFNNAISNNSSGNPLSAPVDYLGAVAKGQQTAIKTLDTAQLKQAIQNFQITEERFPTSLQELVTKGYLREIPAAPYGMKIDYDAKTGVAKVVKQ
jgi:hypothetical protein